MATGEQLKSLVKSHIEGDEERFFTLAMQVAAYEARRGHGKLAQDIRALIDNARVAAARSPESKKPTPIVHPRGELAGLFAASYPKLRLSDMVLNSRVKSRLSRVLREQRARDKLRSYGLQPRRKLLLIGPPGSGKTMTAEVLAGELHAPLFVIRLDSLITKFMGETAAKLRLVFDAMLSARGVYLFDEFDSIGAQRVAVETDSPAEARDVVRRLAERRVDAIKIVHHGGCRGHGAPYYLTVKEFNWHAQMFKLPRAVLEAIIDEAHKCGLKATVHTFDEDAVISVLEAGADGLEHGVVNQRLSSDRVIKLLQKNHATYVPTLWILGSELTYANLKEVADAGVRVALGTDTFCGHGKFGENTIVEAERAAQAEIAPVRVLRMATKDAAEHLGADLLGMIAPGRFADLLLVDGDPTANISALRNVSMVMKNGEILIDKLGKN